jgi:hypothetical protein
LLELPAKLEEGTMNLPSGDKQFSWGNIGVIGAMLVQFGAMIWWGATLTAGLSVVRTATQEFRASITVLTSIQSEMAARLTVVESKVDDLRTETKARELR